ncbi:DNA topoisomerase 2-like isoform X2 [Quercus suber]|uniref:DNA topoisomerase 2-like isoform X2 n=1 Tax=Quercus suber TaxID=58331 RepID=UPI0032E028F9
MTDQFAALAAIGQNPGKTRDDVLADFYSKWLHEFLVFSNNMGTKSEPVISKCKESENWSKVSFKPDLAKFNMTYVEDDVVALMKKRVFDLAGCVGKSVKVELNGTQFPIKSFTDYDNLYLESAAKSKPDKPGSYHVKVNDRWEICMNLSDRQFQQVSFVNSIATTKDGTHVDYITNQITNHIMNFVDKNANIKAHNVKNYLWVFVNALIDNPTFDSQTKEILTVRESSFGSKCEVSQDVYESNSCLRVHESRRSRRGLIIRKQKKQKKRS